MTDSQTVGSADVVLTAAAHDSHAAPTISLQTAVRILRTIEQNGHEPVAFWSAKTAYSGVYQAAVKNGWIEDGVFVTDIPEGVDGGFLAADMRRISLMARLLIDVLSDRLPAEPAPTALDEAIDRRIEERVREMLDHAALEASIAETFSEALEEIEAAKDDALAEIADALDEFSDR